ncbi:MAG: hypothetical protein NZ480_09040, partial [Bdellovibrionaceae bacterium]|nr:hypothetical protein [Pseudobdellovibrionaceae bacterium]
LETPTVFSYSSKENNMECQIYYAHPHDKSHSNKSVWLFVQKRLINDRSLFAAIMEGYRSILMHQEYPKIIVSIVVPPEKVDVNVSPTKSEVRFTEPGKIFHLVSSTIRRALEQNSSLSKGLDASSPNGTLKSTTLPINEIPDGYQTNIPVFSSPAGSQLNLLHDSSTLHLERNGSIPQVHIPNSIIREGLTTPPDTKISSENPSSHPTFWSELKIIGQVRNTYLVCESPDAIVIIDQHAADERIRFEQIQQNLKSQTMAFQKMLYPLLIDMSPEKKEILLKNKNEIRQLGIQIEEVGPRTIGVTEHVDWIEESCLPQLLHQMAHELLEHETTLAVADWKDHWVATQACHGAIRAGQALSLQEMVALLKNMDTYSFSSFCPHGRPVAVFYPFRELEKDFCRT